MATNDIPIGQMTPESQWGEFNSQAFIIQQFINKVQTCTVVRVDAVTNNGDVSPVGFVNVTPLVNQVDAQGLPTPHVTIFNVPYMRLQGGANAVIIDPKVGDIGICTFASRDISKVKKTKKQANPGSARKYSYSDGLYIGGVLNGTPSQYIRFTDSGITVHSAGTVAIEAATACNVTTPTFTVNGATVLNGPLTQGTGSGGGAATMQGPLTVTNDVTAGGVSLKTHKHGGVQTGSGQTGTPV